MKTIWHQSKVTINRLLGNPPPEPCTIRESDSCLPHEIMEMIIAHIAHDLATLKAFSLTCRSWYIAAVPHLHHTLTLTDNMLATTYEELKPLSKLHRLGLMPLIRKIQVIHWQSKWFAPRAFSRRDLRYFPAFTNVHTLKFHCLDISPFIPGVKRYFGHFSPTLRSIEFVEPFCTPQQLSHFLSLFENLDDIKICGPIHLPKKTTPDTELVPLSTPRLQGRLVVLNFDLVETWTGLITAGHGLRFRYMELWSVGDCAPVLLEACAETLETLRFNAADVSAGE